MHPIGVIRSGFIAAAFVAFFYALIWPDGVLGFRMLILGLMLWLISVQIKVANAKDGVKF